TMNPGSWTVQNPDKRVKRGDRLMVFIDFCVHRHESPQVDTLIEQADRHLWLLDTQYPPAPSLGCHQRTIPLITVPRSLPIEATSSAGSGTAMVHVTFRYHVNALREIQYSFTTEQFIIDP